jgi:hypothetical protein
LNVGPITNGTRRLLIDRATETLSPEVRAKAKAAMHSAEVRAKLSAIRKGRRQHPNTTAAFREMAKRPKPDEWKRAQSERSRKMWENPEAYGLPARRKWTDEEIALLGTDTDRLIAKALDVPMKDVRNERARRGISCLAERWKPDQIELLGTAPDSELARKFGKSSSAVWRKREQLGIPVYREKPWTAEEIALIGTASDPEVARRLGRTAACVQSKRDQLGIPAFIIRWTPAEVALLGTDTDRNIANLLGRTPMAVKVHRNKLKIRRTAEHELG